ncbi:1-phosphofructokinase family hexose kinase [Devriesea agamarum]|uniref:1-phosphofructokinase family hexose kinase n=1 Tax=Devriesea agamarum TaxID=472569 RepID=UPI00071D8550|nr:1-phosphofructokinase family hexose kinase [Devriesea agamarum]
MILTLTANPSLDRTVSLTSSLKRGEVQRFASVREDPGGKGVNVTRALVTCGIPSCAVLPGGPNDPVVTGLHRAGIPIATAPITEPLRTNLTLTEPDGTTTKLNAQGPPLSENTLRELTTLLIGVHPSFNDNEALLTDNRTVSINNHTFRPENNAQAPLLRNGTGPANGDAPQTQGPAHIPSWIALCGSLPPQVPPHFYRDLISTVRQTNPQIRCALDTSGPPLREAVLASHRPALIKPNAEELTQILGHGDPAQLEQNPASVASLARDLIGSGLEAVLVTLGGAGAVLVTTAGAWHACAPKITVRSTVGAGDCSLAGYLTGRLLGDDEPSCLRRAVAHGSAAAALPGTAMPTPDLIRPDAVTVTSIP